MKRAAGATSLITAVLGFIVLVGGCVDGTLIGDASARPVDAGVSGTGPVGRPIDGQCPDDAPDPCPCLGLGEPADDVHQQFFDLLNDYRVENGLAPLEYSVLLEQAADVHAASMYDNDFFGHVHPVTRTGPADRALAAGFCHEYVGENIAWGRNSRTRPAEVIDGFSLRPVHNDNMLRPDYRYVGVGIFHTENEEGDWTWWVQDFALDVAN
ncbi:MAG: CAP domain-containing protein [bacterium]|nr:CAP domain-containing protein [bacterium]